MPRGQSLEKRFWDKVKRGRPNECWHWVATKINDGYGLFWNGRLILAHRMSWILHKGEIPNGLCVLHKCDVRDCVNPAHLFLGTNQDNVDDCRRKGRLADTVGIKNGRAKLTEKQVREIRKDKRTQEEIGRDYGITHTHVSYIKRRKNWTHI